MNAPGTAASYREPGWDDDEPAPPPAPAAPLPLPPPGVMRGKCAECGAEDVGLHPRPGSIDRRVCGKCAGDAHRRNVDRTRDVIRELRAAAGLGRYDEERTLSKELAGLVGPHQATETIRAIEAAIANKDRGGGGGGRGGRR